MTIYSHTHIHLDFSNSNIDAEKAMKSGLRSVAYHTIAKFCDT